MEVVILGLGSNVGDRAQMLRRAMAGLAPFLRDLRLSSVYESRAVLPPGAPEGWNMPFLNCAAAGVTALEPEPLLEALKTLEEALGRTPRGHWGPREIDIDILAYGSRMLRVPGLSIPHPELLKRDFALLPLAELAPGWIYPVPGPEQGMAAEMLVRERGYRISAVLQPWDERV